MPLDVAFLLAVLANVRLMHWQTRSYARHVATDDLLKALTPLVDAFVEAHMGRVGAIVESDAKAIDLHDRADPVKYLRSVRDRLEAWSLPPDLQSVRDDMLVALNKTLFLLTLK